MNVCKNICDRFNTRHYNVGYNILGTGWKKCRTCCLSIETDEMICPCCRRKLSVRRRHNYENRKYTTLKCRHVGNYL
ncbi:MAG: hypothetical protein H8D92_02000 [Pelagibacteraceae bacterium]|jgi:hypothetical protein|nr:hypothetical protein [Pelagibacteraceae bacterium]